MLSHHTAPAIHPTTVPLEDGSWRSDQQFNTIHDTWLRDKPLIQYPLELNYSQLEK